MRSRRIATDDEWAASIGPGEGVDGCEAGHYRSSGIETFQSPHEDTMTTSTTPGGTDAVLDLRDVSKSFGPVVALRSGSIRVEAGSIHALVGENGAGKSTLVKVVAGVHRRDGGDFLLGGEEVDFGSTAESKDAGIAVIYQEPTLFPDLSVTENIFMGRQPVGSGRRIDRSRHAHRGQGALLDGSASTSTRGARRSACPSPTSRSSRSPRRSRSTPGCSSWTSPRRRSAATRWSDSSRSPAACATRAARWSSSPTASTRCSRCATRSP